MIRTRLEPSTSRRVSSTDVPPSQTWSLSQEANKKCGVCRVCFATRQLHMKDGTVHNHGPRSKLCSGSHQPPLPDSIQQRRSAPVLVDAMDAVSTAQEAATPTRQLPSVPASIVSVVSHPCCNNGDILKRIPKGARSAAANLLSKLIRDVLQHPLSTSSWSKLLGFLRLVWRSRAEVENQELDYTDC